MFRQPWQKLSSLLSPKDDIRLDSEEDFSEGGRNVITATDNSPSQDLTGMIKLKNLGSFCKRVLCILFVILQQWMAGKGNKFVPRGVSDIHKEGEG